MKKQILAAGGSLRKMVKSQVIEIIIPDGTTETKFQFEDQENLRRTHFMGFETYSSEEIPVSILSNTALPTLDLLKSIFITWQVYRGENDIWQTPAISYKNSGTSLSIQNYSPRMFSGQRINWPKSYIEIADISLLPPGDVSFFIEVFYQETTATRKRQAKQSFRKRS